MAELFLRFQSAPGQEAPGDAHTGCAPEGCADVELNIFRQIRAVNDVDDLPAVFVPVIPDKAAGNMLQLLRHHEIDRAKAFSQRVMDGVHMFIFQ